VQTVPTTPFGRRSLSLAVVAREAEIREFAERPDSAASAVHKWRLFRALTEGKDRLGVSDRALSVLHALLSFHQETALTLSPRVSDCGPEAPRSGLVVFPSNRELSLRAHGMAPATLRRHLAALVEAGLILRRDSPNGKRYARRGQGGAIEDAFGFDLTPLVARAAEIERFAEAARAERRALALLRERITLLRRDIVKMIEAALNDGVAGDWTAAQQRYVGLVTCHGRKASKAELEAVAEGLAALAEDIRNQLEKYAKSQNMLGSESQNERQIQNQNTNFPDSELASNQGERRASGLSGEAPAASAPDERRSPPERSPTARAWPLAAVLGACPDILDYAKNAEIFCWRDLIDAADVVRPALGVSPDAWSAARDVMGEQDAAIVLAAILQRGAAIRSAGGYLRVLTSKTGSGAFSIGPVLMALLRGAPPAVGRRAG